MHDERVYMKTKFKGILPAIASLCDDMDNFLEDKFIALAESLYSDGIGG